METEGKRNFVTHKAVVLAVPPDPFALDFGDTALNVSHQAFVTNSPYEISC